MSGSDCRRHGPCRLRDRIRFEAPFRDRRGRRHNASAKGCDLAGEILFLCRSLFLLDLALFGARFLDDLGVASSSSNGEALRLVDLRFLFCWLLRRQPRDRLDSFLSTPRSASLGAVPPWNRTPSLVPIPRAPVLSPPAAFCSRSNSPSRISARILSSVARPIRSPSFARRAYSAIAAVLSRTSLTSSRRPSWLRPTRGARPHT